MDIEILKSVILTSVVMHIFDFLRLSIKEFQEDNIPTGILGLLLVLLVFPYLALEVYKFLYN